METEEVVGNQLSILVFASLLSILTIWVASRLKFFDFPFRRVERDHVTLKNLLAVFFVFLFLQLIILPAIALLFLLLKEGSPIPPLDTSTHGWLNFYVMFFSSIGTVVYCRYVWPCSFAAIWSCDSAKGNLVQFSFGILTWFICYPVMIAASQLTHLLLIYFFQIPEIIQEPVKALQMVRTTPLLFFSTAAVIIFLIPLTEETLFRGYLQTWLMSKLKRFWAILISSIIFALFHSSYSLGIGNAQILLPVFVLSCFLGFIYERQGSLWAPFGLHAFFNATSVVTIILT